MKSLFHLIIIFCFPIYGFAQKQATINITGKIIDVNNSTPLSYATVQLMRTDDDLLIDGIISDDKGEFILKGVYGEYYILVDFIGYEQFKMPNFKIEAHQKDYNVGIMSLVMSAQNLDEVVIKAEKSIMEIAFDKKIFNVSKDMGNAGGSAIDILNNIPSVMVDGQGNIQLRGSNNVRVLIDGKPSALLSFKGAQGLQQLQGSMIESVEVITNPSAKYEAEGMAGIINIVLKKERKNGFNGSFESTLGNPVNLGLGINLNYRYKNVNFFINQGLNYRKIPSIGNIYQEVYTKDTTFITTQTFDGRHIGFFNNIRAGLDFFLTEKDIFTVSYMYSSSRGKRISDIKYQDFTFNQNNLQFNTFRNQNEDEIEPISEYILSYKKLFSQRNHELNAEIRYFDHWEKSDQVYTQDAFFANGDPFKGGSLVQTSLNYEYETLLLGQLDYVYPFGKNKRLETGFRYSFRDMNNDYLVSEKNESGDFISLPNLDNNFIYKEGIAASYGIFSDKYEKFAYQIGLRAEWTNIETILERTKEQNPRKYNNFFPSFNLTYDLPQDNALQLSYSYRIRRPVYDDLSPFVTFSDNRNFFSGNPDLNPEFSDVIELGHIKYFELGSLSSAIYYRYTDDKIERIRKVDENGFSDTRPENLIDEQALGLEFISSYKITSWWKLDFNFNMFGAKTDGSNIDKQFTAETFSWFTRKTSKFDINKTTSLQLRANYNAPQNIAQGRRKDLYYFDIALSKEILKCKGIINLNITDILNSRIDRVVINGATFFTESERQRIRRQINLSFSYKINQD